MRGGIVRVKEAWLRERDMGCLQGKGGELVEYMFVCETVQK